MTAPHPDGRGAIKVMRNCLDDAGLKHSDIDLINMHGTSTPLGDIAESKAVVNVFQEHSYDLNINSTKSMTGHLLGAAGAIEAISCILAMKHNIVPPTINHFNIDDGIDANLNFTFSSPQKRNIKVAMSNTFGFGGHNACVIFKEVD
tara:strand:- start:519 stop:959 length:441 start_codon:yes stop_codon:yes gene_type:complete